MRLAHPIKYRSKDCQVIQKGFKRVILYARQWRANQDVNETLHHVASFLKTQGVATFIDEDTAAFFAPSNLEENARSVLVADNVSSFPIQRVDDAKHMIGLGDQSLAVLPRDQWCDSDLMVVVGGDGSLLSAAHVAIQANIAVIGINRGYLGFLTDLSSSDFENRLGDVISGHCVEEPRALLAMQIYQQEALYAKGEALNDVVLSRGNETRLISFDVYVDGLFVSHYRADGLIVSTPTGSTAYALSAGGPILHPALDAMVMVPMFSHSLSSRPLVVDGQSKVEVLISESNEHALQISCDGHDSSLVKPLQRIVIQKHQKALRLLHPTDYHYYDTLRFKLGWGSAG